MQTVGTPRFYVDYLQWWKTMGRMWHSSNGHYFWNAPAPFNDSNNPNTNNLVLSLIGLNPSAEVSFTEEITFLIVQGLTTI